MASVVAVLSHIREGALVRDGHQAVLFANDALASMLGGAPAVGQPLGRPLDAGAEVAIVRADGSDGVAKVRVEPITWGEHAAELVLVRDVTAERHSADLRARLLHADRLAAIGQLAAGVAHEVNNPLAFLLANHSMMQSHLETLVELFDVLRAPPPGCLTDRGVTWLAALLDGHEISLVQEEMAEMLGENAEGVRRIGEIVRDLSRHARSGEHEVALVQVNDVVADACSIAAHEIRHRARLVQELGELPPIAADRGQLIQVLTNLLLNAAQAIEEGAADRNAICVTTANAGPVIRVTVRDTGCGIAAEHLSRIFEPFFTTKGRDRGTGLGLSLSVDLLGRHGGTLSVESEVGVGSQFTVELPVETGLMLASPRSTAPPADLPSTSARVLLIDDEAALLAAYRRVLEPRHEVVIARGGQEALLLLDKDSAFDVVICDVMMPDLDGPMIYAAIEERAPHLLRRLVFCSGGAFTDRTAAFVDRITNPCLEKPLSAPKLRHIVESIGPDAER